MQQRLYRSQKNRVIAGVAGGLAEYFDVDVVLVRLLLVLSIFWGGGGVIVYIIAWIIIPEEKRIHTETGHRYDEDLVSEEQAEGEKKEIDWKSADEEMQQAGGDEAGSRKRRNAGMLLVGLGIIFLTYQLFGPLFRFAWPLLLVALGIYLIARDRREGDK